MNRLNKVVEIPTGVKVFHQWDNQRKVWILTVTK